MTFYVLSFFSFSLGPIYVFFGEMRHIRCVQQWDVSDWLLSPVHRSMPPPPPPAPILVPRAPGDPGRRATAAVRTQARVGMCPKCYEQEGPTSLLIFLNEMQKKDGGIRDPPSS